MLCKSKTRLNQEQFDAIARAVADPRRFAMLQSIAGKGSMPCSCLREEQPISPATISHHLKELTEAGLVDVSYQGRTADIKFRREMWDAYLKQLQVL